MLGLSDLHQSQDYLTHEKLWVAFLHRTDVDYRPSAFLFDTGRWRGFDWSDIREVTTSAKVLVLGHEDVTITREIANEIINTTPYRTIYAANLDAEAAKLPFTEDLPLGIPNDERHSRTHIVQADQGLITRAWHFSMRRFNANRQSDSLYGNFSVRTNPQARRPALESLFSAPNSHIGEFGVNKRARLRDLKAMSQSLAVLCPRGHGFDTHRFWECLLVGGIPIVLEDDHCARLARQLKLPFVAVKSWLEIQEQSMIYQAVDSLRRAQWDYSPLSSSYWVNKISSSARESG